MKRTFACVNPYIYGSSRSDLYVRKDNYMPNVILIIPSSDLNPLSISCFEIVLCTFLSCYIEYHANRTYLKYYGVQILCCTDILQVCYKTNGRGACMQLLDWPSLCSLPE